MVPNSSDPFEGLLLFAGLSGAFLIGLIRSMREQGEAQREERRQMDAARREQQVAQDRQRQRRELSRAIRNRDIMLAVERGQLDPRTMPGMVHPLTPEAQARDDARRRAAG